jgi:hypothetical protein
VSAPALELTNTFVCVIVVPARFEPAVIVNIPEASFFGFAKVLSVNSIKVPGTKTAVVDANPPAPPREAVRYVKRSVSPSGTGGEEQLNGPVPFVDIPHPTLSPRSIYLS